MSDAPDRQTPQPKSAELTDLPDRPLDESTDAKVTGGTSTTPIIRVADPCWRPGDIAHSPIPPRPQGP
jgi:hypothetical protein